MHTFYTHLSEGRKEFMGNNDRSPNFRSICPSSTPISLESVLPLIKSQILDKRIWKLYPNQLSYSSCFILGIIEKKHSH